MFPRYMLSLKELMGVHICKLLGIVRTYLTARGEVGGKRKLGLRGGRLVDLIGYTHLILRVRTVIMITKVILSVIVAGDGQYHLESYCISAAAFECIFGG